MPTIPKNIVAPTNGQAITNAVVSSSADLSKAMEVNNIDVMNSTSKAVGQIIVGNESLENAFLSNLYNRIARVIITSKSFYNPMSLFKKGLMDYGETVEEIFVNLAKVNSYNPEKAESEFMKRVIPDVRTGFHKLNYQKFYKDTLQNENLRQAFLSWSGVTDLISKIVESMYTSAQYDEFLATKYMVARALLNGHFVSKQVPEVNADNANAIVTQLKTVSNDLLFLSTEFNYAKVYNHTPREEQYLIMNSSFDSIMNVNVLASAFNMDKAQFLGQQLLIDGFGKLDLVRLQELFGGDEGFTLPTQEELALLDKIPCVIVDKDFFMIFDNMYKFTEMYNGEGIYWQYWYHVWKVFSTSRFANAVAFLPESSTVTSVTISPATANLVKGSNMLLTATVTGTGFIDKSVRWEIEESTTQSIIEQNGILRVSSQETLTELTIKATSYADSTKTGTATITLTE